MMRNLLLTTTLSLGVASSSFASGFYDVGECYAFIPRVDALIIGKVVEVTPGEVVFKNYGRIWPKDNTSAGTTELQQVHEKGDALEAYMKASSSERKKMLINSSKMGQYPLAYSRAALTSIKIGKCE